MKRIAIIFFAGLAIFVFGVLPLAARSARPRVDARVLQDVANGQVANFLVVLKSQADARTIGARAPNHVAQGRNVYSALRQTADATQPSIRAQLDALGAPYRAYWIVNLLAVEGNRAVLDAVLARSDVLAIESDRAFAVQVEPPATSPRAPAAPAGIEWNISQVNAPLLWTLGVTGTGQVYANADTGVQWDHPALKPHYHGWNGSTADHNYNWWDAIHTQINPSGNSCGYSLQIPCDDDGHGTHTMGTGIGDDGAGNQIGIAPGAQWIACRNMDGGVGRPSTYIECFQFFLAPTRLDGTGANPDLRPDAVGNSYGCPFGAPPGGETCVTDSLLAAMNNLRAAGVFMSVSAGNSGPGCSTVTDPPAIYQSAITIGATDSNDNIAYFSSRGPVTVDGSTFRKPELVAPGVSVRSSVPTNGYAVYSGTSMASPHVAGAVVLLWSAFPSLVRDVNRTEFLLEQSARHLFTAQGCGGDTANQYPNNVFGYGRIDIKAAYDLAAHVPVPSTFFFPFVGRNP